MKASTKRLLALLASAALIFLTLIIYIAVLQPAYMDIQDLRGELQSRVDFYDAQVLAVDYVNNLYGKNKTDIDQLQNSLVLALPDQENVADVVYQIQTISSVNNISISSVNLDTLPIQRSQQANPLVKNYGTLRITVSATGAYSSFKQLLSFIENNIRIMDARIIRVYQANVLEPGIFNYDLVIDTYYQVK